jgi:hypothetical protein
MLIELQYNRYFNTDFRNCSCLIHSPRNCNSRFSYFTLKEHLVTYFRLKLLIANFNVEQKSLSVSHLIANESVPSKFTAQ